MSGIEIGPGTALEVISAALDAGAKMGDVLTLTDSDGKTHTIEVGERIVPPPSPYLFPPIV